MGEVQGYPHNSYFLRSCNATGAHCHWSLQRNLLSNFTLRQIINQSIARYISWHHLSFYLHSSKASESNLSGRQVPSFDLIMWRLLWLANLLVLSRSDISCDDAITKCQRDFTKCGYMLGRIFGSACQSALGYDPNMRITGPMKKTCPLTCVNAIKNLTATPAGKEMETCQCDTDAACLTLKARLQRCLLSREENYTIFSCTEARKRCNKDKQCKIIQHSFLRRCTRLISGVECSRDCKDSQDELLNSELGKALNDCECDGREEPYCRGIRANYEALCKGTRGPRVPSVITSPTERRVMANQQSRANSQFELPVWIFYAAIMAHVYVFCNL